MPEAGRPRPKPGYINHAESFRRAQRYLTWRRPRRRLPRRTGKISGLPRPSFVAAAKQLVRGSWRQPQTAGTSPFGSPSPTPPAPAGGGSTGAAGGSGTSGGDTSSASADFRSEFAALLAFYAARIAAARLSLAPSVAAAIVQALMNEQAVALRGLTDRWNAAEQKQRDEKPERPTQNTQRKDEGPKPS